MNRPRTYAHINILTEHTHTHYLSIVLFQIVLWPIMWVVVCLYNKCVFFVVVVVCVYMCDALKLHKFWNNLWITYICLNRKFIHDQMKKLYSKKLCWVYFLHLVLDKENTEWHHLTQEERSFHTA